MKQARVLTDKQLRAVLNVTRLTRHQQRNRLMLLLSYYAALRACEIASLRVSDVVDGAGAARDTILLENWQTKGNKRQQVVVSVKLQKEIEGYVREQRSGVDLGEPLLLSQKGGAFSSQTIQQVFRQLYAAAGIEGASSHSGRRTMLTKLAERGVHARVIQQIARHSSLATTQRYIDVAPHVLRNAVDLI